MRLGIAAVVAAGVAAVLVVAGMQATTSGYVAAVTNSTNNASTAQAFTCAAAIGQNATNAYFAYRLNDPNNSTTASDISGHANNGGYGGTMRSSLTTPVTACPRDTLGAGSYAPTGNNLSLNPSYLIAPTAVTNPTTFSLEVWFKTSQKSGRILSFGSSNGVLGTSSLLGSYDRALYINSSGYLVFGMTAASTISTGTGTTPTVYADNTWHQAIVSVTAGSPVTARASVSLYVDGVLFSTSSLLAAGNYTGYWRIGWDTQAGWPDAGPNDFFNGNLRFVAAYSIALTQTQVTTHYLAGVPQ